MKILSFLALWFCAACGYTDNTVFRADANAPVFTVTLPGNATTGYRWSVTTYDDTLFRMTASKYVPSSTTRIGAGGQAVFTFKHLTKQPYPKSTAMMFTYARPWEPTGGSVKKITVYFVKTSPASTR